MSTRAGPAQINGMNTANLTMRKMRSSDMCEWPATRLTGRSRNALKFGPYASTRTSALSGCARKARPSAGKPSPRP